VSNYFGGEPTDSDTIISGALFLGIGLFLAWGIGKERAWNDALNWATAATQHCETSYRAEGFSSVTDCLKGAIAKAEEEEQQAKQEDGPPDPRG
jgi:hypothetical protein